MDAQRILASTPFTDQEREQYTVHKYTPRPKKGALTGIPVEILLDADADGVEQLRLESDYRTMGTISRDHATVEDVKRIREIGTLYVRETDMLTSVRREGSEVSVKRAQSVTVKAAKSGALTKEQLTNMIAELSKVLAALPE